MEPQATFERSDLPLESRREGEGEGWQTRSFGPAVGAHLRGRGPGDSFSLPYFEVEDLSAALEQVQMLGGSVVHPGDAWAVCKDSEGSPFGLAALTNEARVLLAVAGDCNVRMRDLANQVGLTERAVYDALSDLVERGYLARKRVGRRNCYELLLRPNGKDTGEAAYVEDLAGLLGHQRRDGGQSPTMGMAPQR